MNLTTDTFGIKSVPTSPEKMKGEKNEKAGDDDEDLPALVFINAVDPSIPVLSNNTNYSQTLPSRHKAQRSDVLQASFEAPPSVSTGKESFSGDLKAAKSTGAINRVITSQPLYKNPQLDDLASQKVNTSCVQLPACGPKQTETEESASKARTVTARESDGYVFMEPVGKLPGKQDSSTTPKNPATTPPAAGYTPTDPANSRGVAESLYDVPRAVVEAKKDESGASNGMEETAPLPTVDTSHYDVPKKLLQERAAALKRESKTPDNSHKEVVSAPPADTATPLPLVTPTMLQEKLVSKTEKKRVPPAKPERKASLMNLKDDKTTKPLQFSIYDTPKIATKVESPNQTQPPIGNLLSQVVEGKEGGASNPAGIYNVPRTALKQSSPAASSPSSKPNEGGGDGDKGKSPDQGSADKAPSNADKNSPTSSKEQAEKPQVRPKPSSRLLQDKVQSGELVETATGSSKPTPLPRKSVKSTHPPLTRELAVPLTEN